MQNCINTVLSEIIGQPVGNAVVTFNTVSDEERFDSQESYRHGRTTACITFTTIKTLNALEDYRYGSVVIYSSGINERFQWEHSAHLIHGVETSRLIQALHGLFGQ